VNARLTEIEWIFVEGLTLCVQTLSIYGISILRQSEKVRIKRCTSAPNNNRSLQLHRKDHHYPHRLGCLSSTIQERKNTMNTNIYSAEARIPTSAKDKPKFGTKEWSDYNVNCVSGCSHDCRYCYAKSMAIQYERKTPDNWKDEVIRTSQLSKKFMKRKDGKRFLFPTTHDITPTNLSACIQKLTRLLAPGNEGIIVTKPHLDCVKALCDVFPMFKDQFIFRFTIGSSNSDTLKFWEPGAPDFDERL
jgi:DNA repair photolyase